MQPVREKALEKACSWLESMDARSARLRVEVLLGRRPIEDLVAALPSEPLAALTWLGDHRLLRHARTEELARHFEAEQRPDGSWPAPDDPGEEASLRASGAIASALARSPFGRPSALERAGAFLGGSWSIDRVQSGAWEDIVTFVPFFSHHPHELADEALQWCGRELERGFRTGAFDAVQTARVLVLCDAQALPGARVDSRELVPAILKSQRPDGGWSRQERSSVDATVDASLALSWLR